MKIKLVVTDWMHNNESVYNDPIGNTLSSGVFHSGSTFPATIELNDAEDEDALRNALTAGYQLVFYAVKA